MKLLRVGSAGAERPAVLVDDADVLDVGDHIDDYTPRFFAEEGIARLRAVIDRPPAGLDRVALDGVRIGPPVAGTGKIVCVGLNYDGHATEAGLARPAEPVLFLKASNTLVGPYDDVLLPRGAKKVDWEVELAIVIGRTARYLAEPSAAAEVIAGYAVSNDVSEREFQLERGGQWTKGKSCETFNPFGPWLVTADEVLEPDNLALTLSVNGELVQSDNTKGMIFGVEHLVWYVSQFMVLEPGDIINTGTPAGVGMGLSPPRYLQPGDVMELTIDGLGTQRQVCRRAD